MGRPANTMLRPSQQSVYSRFLTHWADWSEPCSDHDPQAPLRGALFQFVPTEAEDDE